MKLVLVVFQLVLYCCIQLQATSSATSSGLDTLSIHPTPVPEAHKSSRYLDKPENSSRPSDIHRQCGPGSHSRFEFFCNPNQVINSSTDTGFYLNTFLSSMRRYQCACPPCNQTDEQRGFFFYVVIVESAANETGHTMSTKADWEFWNKAVLKTWERKACPRNLLISYNRQLNLLSVHLEDGAREFFGDCMAKLLQNVEDQLLTQNFQMPLFSFLQKLRNILKDTKILCQNPFAIYRSKEFIIKGVIISLSGLLVAVTVVLVYWCREPGTRQPVAMDMLPEKVRPALTRQLEHETLLTDSKTRSKDPPGFWRRSEDKKFANKQVVHSLVTNI